jgi:hypothetical protein
MNNTEHRLLLIAGIPAAGKSHFCGWLAQHHGFVHVDPEQEGRLEQLGIAEVWRRAFHDHDPGELLDALRALGPRVVLDWGFPPQLIYFAEELSENGVELWWFDADRRRARDEFIRRDTVPVAALDIQMLAVQEYWEAIRELFHPNIILVLDAEGMRMEPNAIWQTISGNAA